MEKRIKKLLDNKTLIVILGPTASGKTGAAVELAKLLNIEIISSDSRQIYKYLNIGTAKPTAEEQQAVRHHFVDFVDPGEYYSAGIFGDEAEKKALELLGLGILPVVAGGSGLYIKALCEGFFDEENYKTDMELRDELQNRLEKEGKEALYEELKLCDPDSSKLYTDMNPRRVIRALEYFNTTGIPLSRARKEMTSPRDFEVYYYGIDIDRDKLYEKINLRSEIMWENGLLEETRKVLDMGYSPDLNSLNTVGYKEVIAFFNNEISEHEALEKMKQNTRRYAKRQMTWFRRNKKTVWLNGNNEEIAKQIFKDLFNV